MNRLHPLIRALLGFVLIIEKMLRGNNHSVAPIAQKLYFYLAKAKVGKMLFCYRLPYVYATGNLIVGDYCSLGEFTKIWNSGKVVFGNDVMAAAGLTILTGSHNPNTMEPFALDVRVGDRVWLGADVKLLPGISIGDDAVIGAGSLVTRDVPCCEIWAGVPARKIKCVDMALRSKSFHSSRSIIMAARTESHLRPSHFLFSRLMNLLRKVGK